MQPVIYYCVRHRWYHVRSRGYMRYTQRLAQLAGKKRGPRSDQQIGNQILRIKAMHNERGTQA